MDHGSEGRRRAAAAGLQPPEIWLVDDDPDVLGAEFHRALVEQSFDVCIVVDEATRIVWASPRLEVMLGYVPLAVRGRSVLDFVHPDDRDHATVNLVRAFQKDPPADSTLVRIQHANGGWRWVDVVGGDLEDLPGPSRFALYVREVNQRQETELARRQSDARFRALVQHGSDIVIVFDEQATISYASPAVERILGHPVDDMVGADATSFVHPDDYDEVGAAAVAVEVGGGARATASFRVRTADGCWRWVEGVFAHHGDDPAVGGVVASLRDVTDRREGEAALRRSEERFRALVHNAFDIILVLRPDGTMDYVNPDRGLFGPRSPDGLLGADAFEFVHPDDRAEAERIFTEVAAEAGAVGQRTLRVQAPDGAWHWVEATVTNLLDDDSVNGLVVNARDVTARIEAQQGAQRLLDLLEATDDLVGLCDPSGRILHLNAAARAFTQLTEADADELGVAEPAIWLPIRDRRRLEEDVLPALAGEGRWRGELVVVDAAGQPHPMLGQIMAHDASGGTAGGGVAFYSFLLRDISERKAFEDQLEHQASHDPLTGLPNRTLLLDRLTTALARAERTRRDVAVLFVDLDHFKVLNDSHGHSMGDRVLESIAERLLVELRPEDTVARFGGDEFVVVLEGLVDAPQARTVADRIQAVLARPFEADGQEVFVGASIGIAYATGTDPDRHATLSPEVLLREADAAMYRAKERGRGGVAVFDDTLRARSLHRLDTETALRRALERDQFELWVQPIVDLGTGAVTSAEALIRWRHPDRGLLEPDQFVHVAEETGLIVPIGRWVMEEACRLLGAWRHGGDPGLGRLRLGVNLSGRQLALPDLVDDLGAILRSHDTPPGRLTVEVTESLVMEDVTRSAETLGGLKALGVRIAVDDFGTGYSSLAYLRSFPVDVLKVDRSFVQHLDHHAGDEAIVAAIVRLAHTLGLDAVAEGVETVEQLARLRQVGCDQAQGYLFARPVPPADLRRALADIAAGARLGEGLTDG